MPWGAAIAAVAAVGGAAMQSNAAKKAAKAGQGSADAATAESARQYDLSRGDMQPWLQTGQWALTQQENLLRNPSALADNPQYQWALEQGFKGLDRGAAASGNLFGGGMDADRIRLGQGLAGQQLDNIFNRYASLSQTGQTTANQLGALGANYAQQQQGNLFAGANARASGYANQSNAWGNALGQLANIGGQFFTQNNASTNSADGSVNNFGNNLSNFKGWY